MVEKEEGGSIAGEDAVTNPSLFSSRVSQPHTPRICIFITKEKKEERDLSFLLFFFPHYTFSPHRPTDTSYFWQLAGKILLARREEREVRWPAK